MVPHGAVRVDATFRARRAARDGRSRARRRRSRFSRKPSRSFSRSSRLVRFFSQSLLSLRYFARSPKVRSTAAFQERAKVCLARAPNTGSSAGSGDWTGGRRERVRERARGAPEGTLRRWADGACFVSGARGSGRESGATVTSRARRARARDERGSDAPERGAARKPRASFDRSAFSTLTLDAHRVAIGTARASARTHPNVQERERACGET